MEKMKVKDYAAAHDVTLRVLLEAVSEELDERVTPAQQVDVGVLENAREVIVQTAVDELRTARDDLADAREYAAETVRAAETELRRTVREALKEGMPAMRVAQVLGVSRARVYQIRDGKR